MSGRRVPLPFPAWLWRGGLTLAVLPPAGALVLIIALALGWNSPRPTRPPDWRAPGLPLRLEATPGDTAVVLLDHPTENFTLEVDATPVSGPDFNGYGLIYRAQDETHHTVFAVGSDGYYAVLHIAGEAETPLVDWQQFPHIHRGQQANRLRVSCTGSTCRFYVNDEYATSVEDDAPLTGNVGLWTRSFTSDGVVIDFTDAELWTHK